MIENKGIFYTQSTTVIEKLCIIDLRVKQDEVMQSSLFKFLE